MTDNDFQAQVIEDLAELKTNMRSLIGNGQRGRIGILEDDVKQHGKVLNRIIGALILINSGLAAAIAVKLL